MYTASSVFQCVLFLFSPVKIDLYLITLYIYLDAILTLPNNDTYCNAAPQQNCAYRNKRTET